MKNTNNLVQNVSSEMEDLEIQEIFQKANEEPGEQLIIDFEGTIKSESELQRFVLTDTDDPKKKHTVYYHGIEKLLNMYPKPKTKAAKEAMKILREEKIYSSPEVKKRM